MATFLEVADIYPFHHTIDGAGAHGIRDRQHGTPDRCFQLSHSWGLPYRRWTSRSPTNRSPAGLSLECAGHGISVPRLMSLFPNRSSSHRRVTLAVCWVASSCWNHSRSAPGEPLCSATQKRFRMSTYRSLFTVCVCPSASSEKKGPIMPLELIVHHTVTLGLSGGASSTMSGALEAHTRQFCVFPCPVR